MDSPFIVPVAFWMFVAVAVVAGVWKDYASRRETERTIRVAIEKGQQLDPALVEKMLHPKKGGDRTGLLVGGLVTLAAGLGLPIMGYFISLAAGESEVLYIMIGAGILVAMVGAALIIAWRFVKPEEAGSQLSSLDV